MGKEGWARWGDYDDDESPWGDIANDEASMPGTAAPDPSMSVEFDNEPSTPRRALWGESYNEPCTDYHLDDTTWPEDTIGYHPGFAAYEGDPADIYYRTKTVMFLARPTQIILQNNNGSCPLVAICNVLLLRDPNVFGLIGGGIRHGELINRLRNRIVEICHEVEGKGESCGEKDKWNLSDVLGILPRLREGLNVNLRFRKIDDIEVEPGRAIFDVLDIGLYHGWIVDPQDETLAAIGEKTYDALMVDTTRTLENVSDSVASKRAQVKGRGDIEEERELAKVLALSKTEILSSVSVQVASDEVSEPIYEGEQLQLIKHFLRSYASQLTTYGLSCLQEGLKERELCVFYRNNNFSTMLKLNGELYILAADEGYIGQLNLVWEKIIGIKGESVFMTGIFTEFEAVGPSQSSPTLSGRVIQ